MASLSKNQLMISSLARQSTLAGSLGFGIGRRWSTAVLAFGLTMSVSAVALAGEIKVGPSKLAVDGDGKLTEAGRGAAKEEIASVAGEEVWIVHLWAKLDKGAPGGLNIEFHGQLPDGKPYLTYSTAEEGYDGGKYLSLELELEGSKGFNKNKSYAIDITQLDDKGKKFKLASGKVKLAWTPAPKEPDTGGDEEGKEPDEDTAAQDALDTISGGDQGGGDGAAEGGPPPVDPGKKGCSIDSDSSGALGVLALFVLGASGSGLRRLRARR